MRRPSTTDDQELVNFIVKKVVAIRIYFHYNISKLKGKEMILRDHTIAIRLDNITKEEYERKVDILNQLNTHGDSSMNIRTYDPENLDKEVRVILGKKELHFFQPFDIIGA